jgi:hypothetical protein
MRSFLASILFFALYCTITAQTTFQKIYGKTGSSTYEEASEIIQTVDGGYAVIGDNGSGIYLLKLDANGDTAWSKTFYGSSVSSYPNSIRQTTDGGYIIACNYYNSQNYQALLIKTNSTGNILWSKLYGGSNPTSALATIQTNDGGYVFTGYAFFSGPGYEILVIKTDPSGNISWSKTFGDNNQNIGQDIEQTTDGGYIIAGSSSNSSLNDAITLLKLNSLGTLTWVKHFGNTGSEYPSDVEQTADGGYILAGSTSSFNLGGEAFLLKTSSSGSAQWAKTYLGVYGKEVSELNGGGFAFTGTGSGMALVKTTSTGDTVWAKSFIPPNTSISRGWAVKQTTDQGFILCGDITLPGDTSSIFIVKTDANGNGGCFSSMPGLTVTSVSFAASTPSFQTFGLNTTASLSLQPVYYGINVNDPCVTGINENNIPLLTSSLYPNPNNGLMQMDYLLEEQTGELIIYDITGCKIKTYVLEHGNNSLRVELENLQAGTYLYTVAIAGRSIQPRKIVVIK